MTGAVSSLLLVLCLKLGANGFGGHAGGKMKLAQSETSFKGFNVQRVRNTSFCGTEGGCEGGPNCADGNAMKDEGESTNHRRNNRQREGNSTRG